MNLIINPGSSIATNQVGWTNTHDTAKRYAYEWFYRPMLEEGFIDITVMDTKEERDGRWVFTFTHDITGVGVELEIHGIDDLVLYKEQNIFEPRVYWNGSSSSSPSIENFKADGYAPVLTLRATS